MKRILIEPHYLGNLEYFGLLLSAEEVVFEQHQHFTKQTFKNRCHFLTANGVKHLSVPVKYSNHTAFKDVRIDYSQSWVRDHWGAFYSSYGKAPFFEYFEDHFRSVWNSKHEFLIDLNMEMMTICLKIIQYDMPFRFTDSYEKNSENSFVDLRERVLPKRPFGERNLYQPVMYHQAFGNEFVPNLSIIDLLMSEGTNALPILKNAHSLGNEQN